MKQGVNLCAYLMVAVTLGVLFCFPFEAMSKATVTVGDGSGAPGSTLNKVLISLDNPDHEVMAVQLDVCDEEDYIVVTDVETTSRTEKFYCDFNELEDGCGRMFFFSMSLNTIEKGSGPVFEIFYEVKEDAPLTECRGLNAENITVVDENNYALSVAAVPGEFCFSSCLVNISPKEETVHSGAPIQFSAATSGDCSQGPIYSYEVASQIGSEIIASGLYTAGISATGDSATDTVTVYDIANSVTAAATITVISGRTQGIINYIYPWWILGSRWEPTYHVISVTGKDTYFDHTSRVSFDPDDEIWCLYNKTLGKDVIVALVLLNRNPLVQYVDVTVTTGLGENVYSVTSEYGLLVSLKGLVASLK